MKDDSHEDAAAAERSRLLKSVEAVNYASAAELLGTSVRHIRRLVASQKLLGVGKGHRKKVTSASLRKYGGL